MELRNVQAVEVLDDFEVRLTFDDGLEKVVDLEKYLRGPIFEPLRENRALFRSVHVDEEAGTIIWPNGADIDPNVLYYDHLKPSWKEDEERAEAMEQK